VHVKFLVGLLLPAGAMRAVAIPETRFPSGGRQIEVETFRPEGRAGLLPAVVFLHGADGIEAHGDEYRKTAAQLAGHGFGVLPVHYFDRTGTRRAGLDTITGNSWNG
jgi:dienelactone hydrolase